MSHPGWSTVSIAGKAVDLFVPAKPAATPVVLVYLHGHGLITLKDNPVYTRLLETAGWHAACPHGQRSWWADRICGEFDAERTAFRWLLDDVFPDLEQRFNAKSPNLPLVGVSMGGQGVLRVAYHQPLRFPIVAAIAPALDFYRWHGQGLPLDQIYLNAEAARQDSAILHLQGINWPRHQLLVCDPTDTEWIDGAHRLASKLASSGVPHTTDFTTSHGGHTWDYFNHIASKVFDFVAQALQQESRRLPQPDA